MPPRFDWRDTGAPSPLPCDMRVVRWKTCTSARAGTSIAHLQIGERRWVHSEHVSTTLLAAMLNSSVTLRDGLLDVAVGLQREGTWSAAIQHWRIARLDPELQAGSYHSTQPGTTRQEQRGAARVRAKGWLRLRPSRSRVRRGQVTQLLFFASHEIDQADARILDHYRSQLASVVQTELWLILLADADGRLPTTTEMFVPRTLSQFLWTERALHETFPALATAVSNSLAVLASEPIANHARYYYYHSSLLLWHRHCGAEYPKLRFLWRIEPDVVFLGRMSALLEFSAGIAADLLVPELHTYQRTARQYDHWERNNASLEALHAPRQKWAWSLVSISRTTPHFLTRVMPKTWESGRVMYEEIGLPVTCSITEGCTLAQFARSPYGRNIRWQPAFTCNQALRSRTLCRDEIWHPVKDRSCLAEFLDEAGKSARYRCDGRRQSTALRRPAVRAAG